MTVINILIGLVGLGVVVFVHELGHLLAAKAVGIEVEAFSLGWGRKLIGRTWRGTEYRISVFPIGGYCKMKGEQSYLRALEGGESSIPREPGSFFGARPWQRIVTLVAGPALNFIFAALIMTTVYWVGFSVQTFENRVVIAADFPEVAGPSDDRSPAQAAGIQTGDRIIEMGGRSVESYQDIQRIVAQSAQETLSVTLRRDGRLLQTSLTPRLNRETGAGMMGVFPYVEPVVGELPSGSPAAEAGLQPGDRVIEVGDTRIAHTIELLAALPSSGQAPLTVVRDGQTRRIELTIPEQTSNVGLSFQPIQVHTPNLGFFGAVARGSVESVRTLIDSIQSLRLLFSGVNLTQAVAGPIRISYYIGDIATSGFAAGIGPGLRSVFNFLALLSIVLFFMNLLPIPVLDGGQIVLVLTEAVRGRPPHPKTVYRYQLVGTVLVFGLLIFALFGDILFLANGT
jgi:regulator of sigma E protease